MTDEHEKDEAGSPDEALAPLLEHSSPATVLKFQDKLGACEPCRCFAWNASCVQDFLHPPARPLASPGPWVRERGQAQYPGLGPAGRHELIKTQCERSELPFFSTSTASRITPKVQESRQPIPSTAASWDKTLESTGRLPSSPMSGSPWSELG